MARLYLRAVSVNRGEKKSGHAQKDYAFARVTFGTASVPVQQHSHWPTCTSGACNAMQAHNARFEL